MTGSTSAQCQEYQNVINDRGELMLNGRESYLILNQGSAFFCLNQACTYASEANATSRFRVYMFVCHRLHCILMNLQ